MYFCEKIIRHFYMSSIYHHFKLNKVDNKNYFSAHNIKFLMCFLFLGATLCSLSSCKDHMSFGFGTNKGNGFSIRISTPITNRIVTRDNTIDADKVFDLYLVNFTTDGKFLSYQRIDLTEDADATDKVQNDNTPYDFTIYGINAPSQSERYIYAFANLEHAPLQYAESVQSLLNTIQTATPSTLSMESLKEQVFSLSENTPNRLERHGLNNKRVGYIMSGFYKGPDASAPDAYCKFPEQQGTLPGLIRLKRIDAHIAVTIEPTPGRTFQLLYYTLRQVPRKSYLFEKEQDVSTTTYNEAEKINTVESGEGGFFDEWRKTNFISTGTAYSFDFFMPENRQTPKKAINIENDSTAYHQRDLPQWTNSERKVTRQQGDTNIWEYANDYSTYLIIEGLYQGPVDIAGDDPTRHFFTDDEEDITRNGTAHVKYYIHLGDFSPNSDGIRNHNDFNTHRNNDYTYHITVKGVNNIYVKASRNKLETQPGAVGEIVIPIGSSILLDAHNETVNLNFTYNEAREAIENPEDIESVLSFKVFTPFNIYYQNGVDPQADPSNTSWIRFTLAPKDEDNNYLLDSYSDYSNQNNRLMSITDVTELIQESLKWKIRQDSTDPLHDAFAAYEPTYELSKHLFDSNGNLSFTCFVNENFYDEKNETEDNIFITETQHYYHEGMNLGQRMRDTEYQTYLSETLRKIPTTLMNSRHPDLQRPYWKIFTNKEPRNFNLLLRSKISSDSHTQLYITHRLISQRSIQSFFSTDLQYDREYHFGGLRIPAMLRGYGLETTEETGIVSRRKPPYFNPNRADQLNGRYNHLMEGGPWLRELNDQLWSKFIDASINGKTSTTSRVNALQRGYQQLQYGCLQRNRDYNRNGKIDIDELQWYIPAIEQAVGVNIAYQAFFHDEAKFIYGFTPATQRISLMTSSGNLDLLWISEMFAISSVPFDSKIRYRCFRNIGNYPSGIPENNENTKPQTYMIVGDLNGHFVVNTSLLTAKGSYTQPRTTNYPYRTDRFDPQLKLFPNVMFANGYWQTSIQNTNSNYERENVVKYCDLLNQKKLPDGEVNPLFEKEGSYTNWRIPTATELMIQKLSGIRWAMSPIYKYQNGNIIQDFKTFSDRDNYGESYSQLNSITYDTPNGTYYGFQSGSSPNFTRARLLGIRFRCVRDVYPDEMNEATNATNLVKTISN